MSEPRRSRLGAAGQKVKALPKPNPIERRLSKFLREPPKVQTAASVIVVTTLVIVVAGGVLLRIVDHKEYPNIGVGMWLALQTVTTVGYGDVTPKDYGGRAIAALIMLEGIAFLAIVTAAITSTFITRAARERGVGAAALADAEETRIDRRLNDLQQQLDRLESLLHGLTTRP